MTPDSRGTARRLPSLPRRTLLVAALTAPALARAQAPAPIRCFGPGGPAPAMRVAAEAFRASQGIPVEIIAGPTPQWAGRVAGEADLVFTGAEYMMDEFLERFRDTLDPATRRSLYLRPSALLVRPGNPRGYAGLRDLLSRPPAEARILATGGAGQLGLYEDIAGRTGDVALLRAMRERIVVVAPNTGAAQQEWRGKPDAYDVWLVWNHWQIAAPDHASLVEIEEPFRIWRSAGSVLSRGGAQRAEVRRFEAFLTADEGRAAFRRFGWSG
ncbi:solute-binding protein [Roseomonas eburnea]|uniref:Solute-binding protein n=1 Tax=Neoroseomonas eburnea TaxID=1346889 RepID=A0A9X9XDC3_9PROT|nr:substrate-binding domain-containing protein [Neoroseomonas eburnea]MBR0681709.1 solute-binding protein [Neoroseomonas eburnea]